ncbi:hypothetical protein CYMTET_8925 [Cymbomonas tetramitiformis]|uniref:Uncharacterized protein n=1 Tax=Cymbomonas tetramitiformis TaxID=36881 RepID=A0AAE0GSJ3_9CHLO|nr:hypothetical protein CYMTET_8925 [Cymbomonas tetramitiformis]
MSRKRHPKNAVGTGAGKRQAKRVVQGGRSASLQTLFVAGLLSFLALGLYYLSGTGDTQQKRRARPVSKLLQPVDSDTYSAPARSTKEAEEFKAWETRNVRGTDDLARARRAESLGWQPERLQSRYNVKVLLNEDSRLAYLEDFVTPEECEHLIGVAKRALNGTINNRQRVKYHQPFRAYNYTYVGGDEDAVVGRLEARIADVTGGAALLSSCVAVTTR